MSTPQQPWQPDATQPEVNQPEMNQPAEGPAGQPSADPAWGQAPQQNPAQPWQAQPQPSANQPWQAQPQPSADPAWGQTPQQNQPQPWQAQPQPSANQPWQAQPAAPGAGPNQPGGAPGQFGPQGPMGQTPGQQSFNFTFTPEMIFPGIGVLGALIVFLGSVGPWVKVGPITVSGTSGDGTFTLLLALLGGAAIGLHVLPQVAAKKFVPLGGAGAAVLCLLVGMVAMNKIDEVSSPYFTASAGWGLIFVLLGSLAMGAGGVLTTLKTLGKI